MTLDLKTAAPAGFRQSVDDYIESFHSRNGFSRPRMSRADAAAFDVAVRQAVAPFARDGQIELQLRCTVHWGRPCS